MRYKNHIIALITLLALSAYLILTQPVAQDLSYHSFADQNMYFNIANTCNVLSNLPFLLVGIYGLRLFLLNNSLCDNHIKLNYQLFFIGLMITSFGSGFYHYTPNNLTLIIDRFGIAISFMALFTAYLGEYINVKQGRMLLWPLIALSILSVVYWGVSEQYGQGDLRLYALVQIIPMLLLPIIFICKKWRYSHQKYCFVLIIVYVLAKLVEHFDQQIFNALAFISGHSIKHLLAAFAGFWVCWLLKNRTMSKKLNVD